MRKPLAEIAGDDALNPLIDFGDPLLRAQAKPCAGQHAQAKRRQQTQCQRLTDDMGNLPGLVDLSSDDQRVAIGHAPRDRANHARVSTGRNRPDDRDTLDRAIHRKPGRNLFEITRYPAAIRAKQSGVLNAS